jgi:hypothetical protein
MRLVNLTPHPITLRLADGSDLTLPVDGPAARCAPPQAHQGDEGLPVPVARQGQPGPVVGLPAPIDGVAYIVSGMVLAHADCAGRLDVLAPGTGPADGAIRNEAGHVVAVTRLVGRMPDAIPLSERKVAPRSGEAWFGRGRAASSNMDIVISSVWHESDGTHRAAGRWYAIEHPDYGTRYAHGDCLFGALSALTAGDHAEYMALTSDGK